MGQCCCRRPSKRVKRDKERKKQENTERSQASAVASQFCEREDIRTKYSLEDEGRPKNIGGRLQKYWFVLRELSPQEEVDSGLSSAAESSLGSGDITPVPPPKAVIPLQSPLPSGCPLEMDNEETVVKLNQILKMVQKAPVSQKCPLVLDDKTVSTMVDTVCMNKLLEQMTHPQLHPIHTARYVSKDHMVIIVQPYKKRGSLKDAIYKATPTSEWTLKYSRRSKGLPAERVALYGRQILEGLCYLYGQGFPPLGHIQTGNIFVDGEFCQLGGYENTLLGYKTRSYKTCKDHLEHIDVILFGHVIFEMACGYELTDLVPGEHQLRDVKDQRVRHILEYIFQSQDGNFTATIQEIYDQPFFQEVRVPIQKGARSDHAHLSSDMKALLAKVTKNKPRTQKMPKEKTKSKSAKTQSASSSKPKGGGSGPASSKGAKAAVLEDIRGDRPKLKKTDTDDRSAPKLDL